MSSYGNPPYLRPQKSCRQKLMEGGCCLGVLVILVLIVLPMLMGNSNHKALILVCISNMKQNSTGLLMYVQDYDGRLPDSELWMTSISPYVKNDQLYHCPVAVHENEGAYGYAFHSILSGRRIEDTDVPEKKTVEIEITEPAALPMIFDSHLLYKNASSRLRAGLTMPGRHDSGNSIGFVDGHCKWFSDGDIKNLSTKL